MSFSRWVTVLHETHSVQYNTMSHQTKWKADGAGSRSLRDSSVMKISVIITNHDWSISTCEPGKGTGASWDRSKWVISSGPDSSVPLLVLMIQPPQLHSKAAENEVADMTSRWQQCFIPSDSRHSRITSSSLLHSVSPVMVWSTVWCLWKAENALS